ncbi:MAG: hypothetical protein WC595_04615 [Candidatus Nanoarchaeia archaeon]
MDENRKINGRSYLPLPRLYRDCVAETLTEKIGLLEAMLDGLSPKVIIFPSGNRATYLTTLENLYTRAYVRTTPTLVEFEHERNGYD